MYIYELDKSEREKSKQNKSNNSNSYARPRSNKKIETDKTITI